MSEKGLVVEFTLPSRRKAAESPAVPASDTVPRIARLLALAHKWEGMVRRGEVSGYSDIARLMNLTRGRVTHISKLATLAPDLQERLLLTPSRLAERRLRQAVAEAEWQRQRRLWPDGAA